MAVVPARGYPVVVKPNSLVIVVVATPPQACLVCFVGSRVAVDFGAISVDYV